MAFANSPGNARIRGELNYCPSPNVNNPTVSDTKRAFYAAYTRPINSIYRRVIEELLVEIHLLRVNEDFAYDPVFALGILTTYERFMLGYQPEDQQAPIFQALLQAEGLAPNQVKTDAQALLQAFAGKPAPAVVSEIEQAAVNTATGIQQCWRQVASNAKFKYSRLFAIGLYTLLEQADPELVKTETSLNETLQKLSLALHLPIDKQQKDLELYRANLEKMTQARKTMEDIIAADRRRKEQLATQATSEPVTGTPADSVSESTNPPG